MSVHIAVFKYQLRLVKELVECRYYSAKSRCIASRHNAGEYRHDKFMHASKVFDQRSRQIRELI